MQATACILRLAITAALLMMPMVAAQSLPQSSQNPQSQQAEAAGAIKLSATLVQVPVIVRHPGGRYVTDLRQQDFQLFEDGEAQEIEFFGSINEPFQVALLIDASGSTVSQLERIKDSALTFISKLKDNDQVLVIGFHDSVQVLCDLTGDRQILTRAIRSIRPGEYTQVYEAVYTAVWERLSSINGRKAVILFSDGIDTASSEIQMEDTLDAIVESEDVLIYPIRYNTRADIERRLREKLADSSAEKAAQEWRKLDHLYQTADQYLYKIAELSGGTLERADDLDALDQAFGKIAEELRHQYLLGYYPRRSVADDAERRIRVTIRRSGLRVRARPGYSAAK